MKSDNMQPKNKQYGQQHIVYSFFLQVVARSVNNFSYYIVSVKVNLFCLLLVQNVGYLVSNASERRTLFLCIGETVLQRNDRLD